MPHSFSQLYVHLVFSTKQRQPFLNDSIRPRVQAYLASVMRDLGSPWVVVGGVEDHVHLLFDMGTNASPQQIVEQTKRESSKFVKTLWSGYGDFYWQRGYGMFSVSPTLRGKAEEYVRNQVEHHRTRSFQEEFLAMLEQYGVSFDERYVWD